MIAIADVWMWCVWREKCCNDKVVMRFKRLQASTRVLLLSLSPSGELERELKLAGSSSGWSL